MYASRREFLRKAALVGAGLAGVLAGCQPKVVEKVITKEVERVVKETVIVKGTPQVVEKVVKETVVVKEEAPDLMAKAAEEAKVSVAGGGDLVLDFWNGLTGDDGIVMVGIVQNFTEENPGITVKMQRIPWGIYFDKLMAALVAGTGPDVFILHAPTEVQEWSRKDVLLVLDDLFDSGMLPKDDFNTEVLSGCLDKDGHAIAIPQDAYCPVLWLNLDVFEKAGVEFDPERPPLTRDEFIELCTQLTWDKNGKHPNEPGFDPENIDTWAYGTNDMVGITLRQNGVDAVSMDGSCKATVTDAKFLDALQWGQDIVWKYHFKSGEHWSADEQRLANGKLAMNGNGSWFYGWFKLHPEIDNHAVWPWPIIGEKRGVWVDSHGLCIPKGAEPEVVEAGKKLIKYISDTPKWAAEAGMPTPRKSVAQHPSIATNWALPVEIAQQEYRLPPNLSYPCPSEVWGILNPMIAAVLNNEREPLDAMQEAEPQIQQILDRCCKEK